MLCLFIFLMEFFEIQVFSFDQVQFILFSFFLFIDHAFMVSHQGKANITLQRIRRFALFSIWWSGPFIAWALLKCVRTCLWVITFVPSSSRWLLLVRQYNIDQKCRLCGLTAWVWILASSLTSSHFLGKWLYFSVPRFSHL